MLSWLIWHNFIQALKHIHMRVYIKWIYLHRILEEEISMNYAIALQVNNSRKENLEEGLKKISKRAYSTSLRSNKKVRNELRPFLVASGAATPGSSFALEWRTQLPTIDNLTIASASASPSLSATLSNLKPNWVQLTTLTQLPLLWVLQAVILLQTSSWHTCLSKINTIANYLLKLVLRACTVAAHPMLHNRQLPTDKGEKKRWQQSQLKCRRGLLFKLQSTAEAIASSPSLGHIYSSLWGNKMWKRTSGNLGMLRHNNCCIQCSTLI